MSEHRIYHTAIVGGGQAGLSAGYFLRKAAKDFIILDANERVGDSWRKRFNGLKLFSPQRYNSLPGFPPPGGDWDMPDRLQFADYLENYANHFRLSVKGNTSLLEAVPPLGDQTYWTLKTNNTAIFARHIVIATGAYRTPRVPQAVANTFPLGIQQLHSSEVRDVTDFANPSTSVLLLGAGASGQQIGRLCHEAGADVILAGNKVGNLPRRLLGKDIYWWLYKSGLMTMQIDSFLGKKMISSKGEVTVAEAKIPDGDRFKRIKTSLVAYQDGKLSFDSKKAAPQDVAWPAAGKKGVIIWCTGYRNKYPFLPAEALNEAGHPIHEAGKSPLSGLYYLGLPNLQRPDSSLIGGVGRDAKKVITPLS
jgi:putative flavoprotein involved in K+ transport